MADAAVLRVVSSPDPRQAGQGVILSRAMIVALALAALLASFVALRPLLPIDETRYLDVAWEMWLSADYVHLTRNFAPYTHKPPLLFWLITLVWGVTGVAEIPARLVGPAAGVVLALATAGFGRRLWPQDQGVGVRAMVILSSFTVFLLYASATMFDTLLALAVLGGAAVLWRIGEGGAGWRHWVALGAALGFGTLAKGPVVAIHLLPLFLTMGLWAPAPPDRRRRVTGFALALATCLALVALWLVPALVGGTPEFRRELLWTQSAARVAGGMAHDRPVWFLVALLPVMLFPWGWSVALWRALAARLRVDGPARMLALWAVSALVLFSLISGKQAHYLLPEYPAVALLFARILPTVAAPGGWRLATLVPLAAGLAAAAAATGLVPLPAALPADPPGWALPLVAACAFALAFVAFALPAAARAVLLGAGVALGLHLFIAATGLSAGYDATAIAARIKAFETRGIAVSGMTYNAEFNFAARLTAAVATPETPEALRDWARTHPEGIVLGPVGRVPIAAPPAAVQVYNGRSLGFWPAEVAAVSVRE